MQSNNFKQDGVTVARTLGDIREETGSTPFLLDDKNRGVTAALHKYP